MSVLLFSSIWSNPPHYLHEVRATAECVNPFHCCIEAAYEARTKAKAMGIEDKRLEWFYGTKPFTHTAHVSLLVDGKWVVDNGGLGVNLYNERICPGDVCTLGEARRAYDLWKRAPATTKIPRSVTPMDWNLRDWPR